MCDVLASCACHEAVVRAYGELKEKTIPNIVAFDGAVKVFRYHHPEISPLEAKYTVAEWIAEGD